METELLGVVNEVLGDTGCVTLLVLSSFLSLSDCSEASSLDSVLLIGVSDVVADDAAGVVVSPEVNGISVVTTTETSESSVVKELCASITTGLTVTEDVSTLGEAVVFMTGMVVSSVVTVSLVTASMSVVGCSTEGIKRRKNQLMSN